MDVIRGLPAKSGYYWYRGHPRHEWDVVLIDVDERGIVTDITDRETFELNTPNPLGEIPDSSGWEWVGPLEPPPSD